MLRIRQMPPGIQPTLAQLPATRTQSMPARVELVLPRIQCTPRALVTRVILTLVRMVARVHSIRTRTRRTQARIQLTWARVPLTAALIRPTWTRIRPRPTRAQLIRTRNQTWATRIQATVARVQVMVNPPRLTFCQVLPILAHIPPLLPGVQIPILVLLQLILTQHRTQTGLQHCILVRIQPTLTCIQAVRRTRFQVTPARILARRTLC